MEKTHYDTGESERPQLLQVYVGHGCVYVLNALSKVGIKIETSDLTIDVFHGRLD
jgi:hypothetical protein